MSKCGIDTPCPPCGPGVNPCTGVEGYGFNSSGGFPNDPVYKKIIAKDTTLCKKKNSSEEMAFYDKTGNCTSDKPPNADKDYNDHVAQANNLKVTGTEIKDLIDNKTSPSEFPLQAIFKIWGDGGDKHYNYGVTDRNVNIDKNPENVVYLDIDTYQKKTIKQNVINLELHGNNYSGNIPGLKRNPKKKKSTSKFPNCPKWLEDEQNNKRVGSIIITRDNFGPGVFSVLAYVPKTEAKGKRGYVLAMWTFHYEEMYGGKKGGKAPAQFLDAKTAPCFNQCDGGAPIPKNYCPTAANCKEDTFSAINHEIDIEIPANSPQLADEWEEKLGWDTMNCNTWLGDNFNYDAKSQSHYTQVMVRKSEGDWISKEDKSSNNKDYHWYTIDWHVDENDPTKNYVKFFFDDPKMKNPPLYYTNRFVPTRAGHLNFGGWFGWWGFGKKPEQYCNFDTANIKVAQVIINPYPVNSSTNHPQSYDQPGINCDAIDLFTHNSPNPLTTNTPTPTPTPTPTWLIIVIIVAVLVMCFCLAFIYNKKYNVPILPAN